MKPVNLQVIGSELAIKWDDGAESYITLEKMRGHCPCAGCGGEKDIMGNVYKAPEKPLTPKSFQVTRFTTIGGYAVQPTWADGHSTGLYSYEYLRQLAGS
jgi:DUF971 family protein